MEFRHSVSHFLLLVLFIFCFTKGYAQSKVFSLANYGAIKGGKVDNSKALLNAWGDACKWKGPAQVHIPRGIFLVNPVILKGPCTGPVEFNNRGNLLAPPGLTGIDAWMSFQYLDRLTVNGGGSFDGHGPPKYASPGLPTLVKFNFVTNSRVENVKFMKSMSTHFHLFACKDTVINQVTVSSPGDSPNTDGIKIGVSQRINITNSNIQSGDDCIAIITGTKNITVTGVTCGPGHGISIGSIGTTPNENVDNIIVRHSTFSGTTNGVRIKTKANANPGLVSNVLFENLIMDNVENPIIIDQNYCPSKTCSKGVSRVQINNVKYKSIRGTSKTEVAVDLECSESNPCQDIELRDINLKYKGRQGSTISKCVNAKRKSFGVEVPKSCL